MRYSRNRVRGFGLVINVAKAAQVARVAVEEFVPAIVVVSFGLSFLLTRDACL